MNDRRACAFLLLSVVSIAGQPHCFAQSRDQSRATQSIADQTSYALAQGIAMGCLPADDRAAAWVGWSGMHSHFVRQATDGPVLIGTVRVGGLGGKPYRSGDYAYCVGKKTQDDDPKSVGSYLKAGAAMQGLAMAAKAAQSRSSRE